MNKIKVINGDTGETEYREIDYVEVHSFDTHFAGGSTPIPKMSDNEIMLVDATGAITIVTTHGSEGWDSSKNGTGPLTGDY